MAQNALPRQRTRIKFVIVGIWNTIFGYLVFVGLDSLCEWVFSRRTVAYLVASLLANVLAITHAYIFHKFVTFRSPVKGKNIFIEFARFFSTYVVSIFLGMILLAFFVESLSLQPKTAAAVIIPLTMLVSYFGHSRFSFKIRNEISD